jgi:hypothetical protein
MVGRVRVSVKSKVVVRVGLRVMVTWHSVASVRVTVTGRATDMAQSQGDPNYKKTH